MVLCCGRDERKSVNCPLKEYFVRAWRREGSEKRSTEKRKGEANKEERWRGFVLG